MRRNGLTPIALAVLLGVTAYHSTSTAAQDAAFRARTDLIVADVQVVTSQGVPIDGLTADNFEVSINGRRRRVVSLQYVRHGEAEAAQPAAAEDTTRPVSATLPASNPPSPPRIFILAVDTKSFGAHDARGMLVAGREFIGQLEPTDFVGLFAYPGTPATQINPTTDHAAVAAALDKVVGFKDARLFDWTPTELVDCSDDAMRPQPALGRGQVLNSCPTSPVELAEIRMMIRDYEGQATISLGMFGSLMSALARSSQRKTVVLLSAGIIESPHAGGRPDFSDLSTRIGQEAARANAVVYSVFADRVFLERYAAAERMPPKRTDNLARDSTILSTWLGRAAITSGGEFFRVIAGSGEYAFDRILRETSAYYLLGIEPEASDRDGTPRALKVQARNVRGATVRARSWVAAGETQ